MSGNPRGVDLSGPLKRRWPARYLALAAGAGLLLTVGCNPLRLNLLFPERQEIRPEKETAAATPASPGRYSFRLAPYVFLSDFEIRRDQPLFEELANLRDQVYRELQLPPGNAVVQVYVFEDQERYERFMQTRYPNLPKRRAFFVAQPRGMGGSEDLLVYTYWGEGKRIQKDLRHELTHALLHSVLKDVPLWLDEGLAEFYELPPDLKGVNAAHLDRMLRGAGSTTKPDLPRLESLKEVGQMNPAEYREAWAWVHLMLRSTPEAKNVLLSYLQMLRANSNPGALGPRLASVFPSLDEAFVTHLNDLDAAEHAGATAQR
jgi:hypothetical protein